MTAIFKQIMLPYPEHIAPWFTPLASQPGAIWLDSAKHTKGRYDVFAAHPVLWLSWSQTKGYQLSGSGVTAELNALVEKHQQQEITQQRQPPHTATQAFALVSALRRSVFGHEDAVRRAVEGFEPEVKCWLPGVLGLLSYSLGSIDQGVKRSDQWPALSLGFYGWLVVINHTLRKAWLIYHAHLMADFQKELDEIVTTLKVTTRKATTLKAPFCTDRRPTPETLSAAAKQTISAFNAPAPDLQYRQQFSQVKELLLAGDCYQINLARRLTLPFSGDPYALYCQIRSHTQAPYSGFLKLNQGECLCFSPEHFLTLTPQGMVHTSPIKGTQPRATDPVADEALRQRLCESEKDRAENLMIVDLLRNDLGRICLPGSISVPKLMTVESFTTVHHLVSEVRGQLKPQLCAEDILAASFPGGSITGAPKIRAMQIIDALEPEPRNAFCGSLCHIGANNTLEANICIRTAIKEGDLLTLWAGGGIVIDSDVDTEWMETQWKIQKILSALT